MSDPNDIVTAGPAGSASHADAGGGFLERMPTTGSERPPAANAETDHLPPAGPSQTPADGAPASPSPAEGEGGAAAPAETTTGGGGQRTTQTQDEGAAADRPPAGPAGPGGPQPLDPALVDRAVRAGFTTDDILAFGTEDALRRAIVAEDRRLAQQFLHRPRYDAGPQRPTAAPPAHGPPPTGGGAPGERTAPPETTGTPTSGADGYRPNFEQFDPELQQELLRMHQHYEGKLSRMDDMERTLAGFMRQEQDNRVAKWIHEKQAAETFGAGPNEWNTPGSSKAANYQRLIGSAVALREALEAQWGPQSVPSPEDLLERAYAMEFPSVQREAIVRDVNGRLSRAAAGTTARPTGRVDHSGLSARERTIAEIHEYAKQEGISGLL